MVKPVVVEEFHLTVTAPRGLARADYGAIRRALDAPGFRARLLRSARALLGLYPALGRVRVTLSR